MFQRFCCSQFGRYILMLALTVFTLVGCTKPEERRSQKLFPEQTAVPHARMIWKEFKIDTSVMRNVRVVGRFRAMGGSGNDIQAVLADADNFENRKNGHQSHALYSADKTTVGNIDVAIPSSGTYFFCFSNTFSAFSDKEISTDVELQYTAIR